MKVNLIQYLTIYVEDKEQEKIKAGIIDIVFKKHTNLGHIYPSSSNSNNH